MEASTSKRLSNEQGGADGQVRRRRKANFSTEEVDILVREVAARRYVLFGSGQSNGRSDLGSSKATDKLAAWKAVAAYVNVASRGETRTVREIRKKWENVTSTYRKRQMCELGSSIELEPHLLASSSNTRCPADEVLACARAYQANRILYQQRRNSHVSQSPFSYQTDESRIKDSSSEEDDDDLILDIQPDVHIESLETPLTFADSDDITRSIANSSTNQDQSIYYEGNNKQLLQIQQQLRSGEVIISPATTNTSGMSENNVSECNGGDTFKSPLKKQTIEEQKLAVMRQLLKIESKRLKVEKKRLKIEKIRLKIMQDGATNDEASSIVPTAIASTVNCEKR